VGGSASAHRGPNTGASGRRPNGADPRLDTKNRGEEADCSHERPSGRPGASSAVKLLKVYTSSIFFSQSRKRFAHLCIKVKKSSIQYAFGRPRGQ
jgi:hypothetical protein